jgi:hypothetical protein
MYERFISSSMFTGMRVWSIFVSFLALEAWRLGGLKALVAWRLGGVVG